jgi:hypothetical protein
MTCLTIEVVGAREREQSWQKSVSANQTKANHGCDFRTTTRIDATQLGSMVYMSLLSSLLDARNRKYSGDATIHVDVGLWRPNQSQPASAIFRQPLGL